MQDYLQLLEYKQVWPFSMQDSSGPVGHSGPRPDCDLLLPGQQDSWVGQSWSHGGRVGKKPFIQDIFPKVARTILPQNFWIWFSSPFTLFQTAFTPVKILFWFPGGNITGVKG